MKCRLCLSVLVLVACGGSDTTAPTNTQDEVGAPVFEGDVPVVPTGAHAVTSSDKFGWNIPDTKPEPNSECTSDIESLTSENSIPWQGFQVNGTTYTCNRCPEGTAIFQGDWRAMYDRESSDPNVPYDLDPTMRETLTMDGNTFRMHLSGMDLGAPTEAYVDGWVFCSDKPETVNKAVFFVVTSAVPEGAFGWETGLVFTADVMADGNGLFMGWYEGIVTVGGQAWGGTQEYCPIGGNSADGISCDDPFAQ